jgi:hypothetical protein
MIQVFLFDAQVHATMQIRAPMFLRFEQSANFYLSMRSLGVALSSSALVFLDHTVVPVERAPYLSRWRDLLSIFGLVLPVVF